MNLSFEIEFFEPEFNDDIKVNENTILQKDYKSSILKTI